MSNTNKADVIRKKWHPAGWMPAGFREMWEYAVDLERFLNAAECRIQDLEQPAPQAQEETRGAPAPADIRAGLADTFRGVLREYDAKSLDENEAIEEIFGAIRDFRQPQAPAPASPAPLVWTKEKPKRPGWYLRRMVLIRTGEITSVDAFEYQEPIYATDPRFPDVTCFEYAGPVEPADPEAGAPGTQKLPNLEQLSPAEHRDLLRRAGTQGATCG